MVHVGNDIVDLNSPLVKEKINHERFIQRVLTANEQQFIARPDFPEHMLWVLWAAKETAYKAVSKAVPGISSAPKRYLVYIRSKDEGRMFKGFVKTPDQWVQVCIYYQDDVVHCIGGTQLLNPQNRLIHGLEKMQNGLEPDYYRSARHVSDYVRHFAARAIADHIPCHVQNIAFAKAKAAAAGYRGYPVVRIEDHDRPMDISFSHDGKYVGYAFYYGKEIQA